MEAAILEKNKRALIEFSSSIWDFSFSLLYRDLCRLCTETQLSTTPRRLTPDSRFHKSFI